MGAGRPRLQSQLLGSVVLANIIEAGVAPNHIRRLMLSLVHDLGIVGAIELGDGNERGA